MSKLRQRKSNLHSNRLLVEPRIEVRIEVISKSFTHGGTYNIDDPEVDGYI